MSDKVLYVMQGVPGSGKSTVARMIHAFESENPDRVVVSKLPELGPKAVVISTDDHRLEPDGSYKHDPAKNAEFHRRTQKDCARHMINGVPVIVVDNTNIAEWQAHPYLVLADIYGYTVQVVSVDCGLGPAIDRQSEREGLDDRAVPAEVITEMYDGMERLLSQPRYRPEPKG